jgi:hypothetical protein
LLARTHARFFDQPINEDAKRLLVEVLILIEGGYDRWEHTFEFEPTDSRISI